MIPQSQNASGGPLTPEALRNHLLVIQFIHAALVVGVPLFAAVVTLVTHNVVPVVLGAICAAVLAFRRPSQNEFQSFFRSRPF